MNEVPYPLLTSKRMSDEFDEGIAQAAQFLTAMKNQKLLGSLPIKATKQDQSHQAPPKNEYLLQCSQTLPSHQWCQTNPIPAGPVQQFKEQYHDALTAAAAEEEGDADGRDNTHTAMISSTPSINMNVVPPTVSMVQETMNAIQSFQYQHMFPRIPLVPQILGPMNSKWQILRPQPSHNFRVIPSAAYSSPSMTNHMNHNGNCTDQQNNNNKAAPTGSDGFDVPRFVNGREQQLRNLLTQEDRYLTTQFTFAVVDHLDFVYFEEGDRRSHRTHLPIGFRGIGCKYCQAPAGKSGRFFPSSLKTLSDTNKTLFTLHRHLIKCRMTPNGVKQQLDVLRQSHDRERKLISAHGSQRAFFRRMWGFLCPKSKDKYERKRHNAIDK